MFTGFRSIVMCEKIRHKPNGEISLINLFGDPLMADSRPGFVLVAMSLSIDTDGQRSLGSVTLECRGMDESFPLDTPSGHRVTGAAFFLPIPVLEEGDLVVTVANHGEEGEPSFSTAWGLRFRDDAKVLVHRERTEADIVALAKARAAATRKGLLAA